MKNTFLLIILTVTVIGCSTQETPESGDNISSEATAQAIPAAMDTTPRVTGIGGIFFRSKNPQEIKSWYSENLGLATDDFGSPFEFRNANRPEEVNYLNWDAFPDSANTFAPSSREFMINYRVQNIEGLIEKLRENDVVIVDELATYEYGKFIHIMDPEGTKIELWEPVDSVLSKMGRVTNK